MDSEASSPLNTLREKGLLNKVGLGDISDESLRAYESPSVLSMNEFLDGWRTYTGNEQTKKIEGVYGAMQMPDSPPKAYAFIDIDEVLRGLSQSVRNFFEEEVTGPVEVEELADIHESASGLVRPYQPHRSENLPVSAPNVQAVLSEDPELSQLPDNEKTRIAKTVRRALSHTQLDENKAPPVKQIDEIVLIMQAWREQGIYVSAITATKPGTEAGTLAFLQQYLPDCVDALIFCGKGQNPEKLDKGDAALTLLAEIPNSRESLTALLIDDVSQNALEFKKKLQVLPGSQVNTIVTDYNSHLPVHIGSVLSGDSRLAFEDANGFLQAALESDNHFILSRAPEWKHLQHPQMAVSPEAVVTDINYPEEVRTSLSLASLHSIYKGDQDNWQKLTGEQPPQRRLSYEKFRELHGLFHKWMPDEQTYKVMTYIMLIHDIGKNPDLMRSVGVNPDTGNHDEALQRLFSPHYEEQQKEFLPTFVNPHIFTDAQRSTISNVLSLDFNFPGFSMSQSSRHELQNIESVDRETLALHALHGILDIAGARVDDAHPSFSPNLNGPTVARQIDAMNALVDTPEELGLSSETQLTVEQRNEIYLSKILERLSPDGYDLTSGMAQPDAISQVQLANMFRLETPEQFFELTEAYDSLPLVIKGALSSVLSLSHFTLNLGNKFSLDYGPAFLQALASKTSLREALTSFAIILSSAYTFDHEFYRDPGASPARQLNLKKLVEKGRRAPHAKVPIQKVRFERDGDVVVCFPVDPETPPSREIIPIYPADRYIPRADRSDYDYDEEF